MKQIAHYLFSLVTATLLCSTAVVSAQILQNHPELCGAPGTAVPVPSGLNVITDRSVDKSDLVLTVKGAAVTTDIPGAISEVQEVCPLPGNRALIFGVAAPSLFNLVLVDMSSGSLLDSFYAFSPALSPNKRWLMMRKSYPLGGMEANVSEEYLLYDLTKSRAANRADPRMIESQTESIGRAVYPVGQQNLLTDNIGVPDNQGHQFRSDSFFWSPDSRSVLFADSVSGSFSIVRITIGHDGETKAYTHPVDQSSWCNASSAAFPPVVSNVSFESAQTGTTEIGIQITSNGAGCATHDLLLRFDEFTPAVIEQHTSKHPKPSVVQDQ